MNNKKLIRRLYLQFNDEMSKKLISSLEFKNTIKDINENYKLLIQNSNETSIVILDNLIDSQDKLLALETEQAFINGFSLGINLLFESNKN